MPVTPPMLRTWAADLRQPLPNWVDRDEANRILARLRLDHHDREDLANYLEQQAEAIETQDAKADA